MITTLLSARARTMNGASNPINILVVDDDSISPSLIGDNLAHSSLDCVIEWRGAYDSALEAMGANEYDVVFAVDVLGDSVVIDFLQQSHARRCTTPIIVLSSSFNLDADAATINAG